MNVKIAEKNSEMKPILLSLFFTFSALAGVGWIEVIT